MYMIHACKGMGWRWKTKAVRAVLSRRVMPAATHGPSSVAISSAGGL
jgi:hypothetical protein